MSFTDHPGFGQGEAGGKFGDVPWGALEAGKIFEPFPAWGKGKAQRSVKPPRGDKLLCP